MDQDPWKLQAIERQAIFNETLGSRDFDEIDKTDIFQLKKKIGYATCGKPKELPSCKNYNTGYEKEQLKEIKYICDKVVERSDYDPIKFSCTMLILNIKGEACETPIFRIGTKAGNIFIDVNARVYQNWDMFMQNNKLPDCEYAFPLGGEYDVEKEFSVGFAFSPASKLFHKATSCLDTAGTLAAVAAAGVIAVGTFVSVAPVALSAAGATALCTGVYSVSRNVGSLYDRKKHEQSIGMKDQESRSAWMAIGSSAVGLSQMAALKGAQKVVESGRSLGKISVFGLNALNVSSIVMSGFGFVETLLICADKYNKGKLSKKDVFDLSCELLFFFNAIASAKATSQLVNNMANMAVAEGSSQKKLTKTQKRNLKRRAAKRRAKGLTVNVNEEANKFSAVGISGTVQLILYEAVKAYSPRLQEVLYTCHSIGHDIMCWRTKEISDIILVTNLGKKIIHLYKNYKDEISEVLTRIIHFFNSIKDEVLQFVYKLFETASYEVKHTFCTKVINIEDEMELLIDEAEEEILSLHASLKLNDSISLDYTDEAESIDDNNLNPETKNILKSCSDVIDATNWNCNDLEDFEDILDGVKHLIVGEFKTKVNNYKVGLEAAKAASGNEFNIEKFHEVLGIRGELSQHMFKEVLNEVTSGRIVNKIGSKLKDTKKNKNSPTTPVWEALAEGMFHYYGPHGTGELSKEELLSVVNRAVGSTVVDGKNIVLSDGNYSLMAEKGIVMISINDLPNVQIVVCSCEITEENTASGIIVIVQ